MDEAFHCEALEHYRGLSKYVSGVGWTHLLLPTLGGPTNSTVLELVRRKASGPYVVYMWLYVACMTRLCWWCYSLSAERALPPPLTHRSSAPACEIAVGRARAAVWVHISGSLVRIATRPPAAPHPPQLGASVEIAVGRARAAVWCASPCSDASRQQRRYEYQEKQDQHHNRGPRPPTVSMPAVVAFRQGAHIGVIGADRDVGVGVRPPVGPPPPALECLLSAAAVTVLSAGSVIAGQRGRGPFAKALSPYLLDPRPERLSPVVRLDAEEGETHHNV
eukprot:CAMPEP_0185535658 /NCGR_PEP_ID=MMETSP1366-20130426/109555_1 /TAXON_ID=38817 /ORGANISM="Gephyrocapsa oceanica, Strain RCC1303" /LENGTH=276 /DNA_ID=CAMNT_0028147379 /DNA_START=136 /DNA_END=968 /DNA_ORIENTATION=-